MEAKMSDTDNTGADQEHIGFYTHRDRPTWNTRTISALQFSGENVNGMPSYNSKIIGGATVRIEPPVEEQYYTGGERERGWSPDHRYYQVGDQLPMFMAEPKSPAKLDFLAATPGHEHLVPALLAAASKDAKKTWGEDAQLTYSDDLSEHSSKVVQTALKHGLVTENPKNPNADRTNDINKNSWWAAGVVRRETDNITDATDRAQRFNYEHDYETIDPSDASEALRKSISESSRRRRFETVPHLKTCLSQDHAHCSCHAKQNSGDFQPELPFGQ
jgi:hypothetical protein